MNRRLKIGPSPSMSPEALIVWQGYVKRVLING